MTTTEERIRAFGLHVGEYSLAYRWLPRLTIWTAIKKIGAVERYEINPR